MRSGSFLRFALALAPLSAAALVAAPASAQEDAPRFEAAPVEELIAQVEIPFEEFTLDNGLRVIVHEDRKAPIVAVSVWYDVGSGSEPIGQTGYAHLFEHLMFNGSENAPGDYFQYTSEIGATDLNGTTWLDRTNYFQTVPRAALEAALFLESDRMGYFLTALDTERLENQIGVVSNEKRQGDNQPYGMVDYRETEILFPIDHPYGHSTIGSLDDLAAASLDDMRTWFTNNYGPNNAILVLAGDIDAAEARPLVERWFAAIPRGPQVERPVVPIPTLDEPVIEVMHDRVASTRIQRSWVVPGLNDPDSVALDVGATVLGGLASSRLDNILVRGEQSAVSVRAFVQPFVHASIFQVVVDLKDGEDVDAVSARLDAIMADLIENGPTEAEVQRVVTREVSGTIAGLEQVGGFGGKAVTLAEGALYSDDAAFYRTRLGLMAEMTPATVAAAMQTWLTRPMLEIRVIPGEREEYEEVEAGQVASVTAGHGPAYYITPSEEPLLQDMPAGDLPDRSQGLPSFDDPADLDYPDVVSAELSNGIPVYFAQRDAVPQVRIAMTFDVGSAADSPDRRGVHGLVAAMMDEGTATLSAVEIAEAQETLGAGIGVNGGLDTTSFTLRAVRTNLAPSLDLFADVVRNPAFDSNELERVRAQQLNRIAAEETQPIARARRVLPPLIYGEDHPYGGPLTGTGDAAVVADASREELVAFHNAWFRPDKAAIYVVGDTSLEEIVPMLEARFGSWAVPTEAAPEKNFDAAIPEPQGRIIVVNQPNSPQSLIFAGEVLDITGRDDQVTLRAANEVLGGDFLSRINFDLRETKGWSYGSVSFLQGAYADTPFLFFAGVQTNRTGDSIGVIIDQMTRFIGEEGVTPAELNRTVRSNVLQLPGQFELSNDVLGQMQNDRLLGRPFDFVESLPGRYRAMTQEDLNVAMREALSIEGLIWVVVGDAAAVEPQLAELGLPVEYVGYDPDAEPPADR